MMSISKMGKAYLAAYAKPSGRLSTDAPILRSVKGVLKRADVKGYKQHLANKYR
jgi:hypothetical protein